MNTHSTGYTFLLRLTFSALLLTGLLINHEAFSKSDTTFSVEFKVNMSKAVAGHIFLPDSDAVFVLVDHGIAPLRLVIGPDNVYSGTLQDALDSGVVYHYHFRINTDLNENVTRSFTAKQGLVSLYSWWNDDPMNQTTFMVNMALAISSGRFNPLTDSVCIVGTMNNMKGSPRMQKIGTSQAYSYTYALEPGDVHSYKYRINGDSSGLELLSKPARMMLVPDTLLKLESDYNNYNPAKRSITFNCNMGYYIEARHFDPTSQYLDVAGNFNAAGVKDVLFDPDGDSIYSLEKYLDTTWFSQGPLQFKFRIDGDIKTAELIGKPARNYNLHDTVNHNPNIYNCYFNNLDPAIPTPPWVYDVAIHGFPYYKRIVTGSYSYENVNGIAEGQSTYRWMLSDNSLGLNATPIDSAWKINYQIDTVNIGKYLVFEVTPRALSGDSAIGKTVRVVTAERISAWDLGIGSPDLLAIRIYPNPAQNVIRIATEGEVSELEIYNALEQLVLRKSSWDSEQTLLVENLPAGIYFIHLSVKNGKYGVARFIKM